MNGERDHDRQVLSQKPRDELMGLPLFHVDAFADRPFAGNPAARLLLPDRGRTLDAAVPAR